MKRTFKLVIVLALLFSSLYAWADEGEKQKEWGELVAYFSAWKIDKIDAASFLLQTDWNVISEDKLLGTAYEIRVSVLILADLSLKTDIKICSNNDETGRGPEIEREWLKKTAKIFPSAKKALEEIEKIERDLNSIETQYKTQGEH